jgi:hypothetical protein
MPLPVGNHQNSDVTVIESLKVKVSLRTMKKFSKKVPPGKQCICLQKGYDFSLQKLLMKHAIIPFFVRLLSSEGNYVSVGRLSAYFQRIGYISSGEF